MEKKNKIWRFLFAALMVCAALSLLGDLAAWVVQMFGGLSFGISNAASIGIIGGADGPTAIFVTASVAPVWFLFLKILLLVVGVLGWRYFRKRK